MHPELLNNSLFLRYYAKWQHDPTSIAFAPIADFFLRYHLIDEAFKVCREGLSHHPKLISGRFVLAKIHLKRGNIEEAWDEVREILAEQMGHQGALMLLKQIQEAEAREASRRAEELLRADPPPEMVEASLPPAWKTVTMARIFAAQGHVSRARDIYAAILQDDPHNRSAQSGFTELSTA